MPKPILEKDIQRAICDWLATQKHLFFWRQNNTPVHGRLGHGGEVRFRKLPKYALPGVPDIFVVNGGAFIGLEVKTPKRKLSTAQSIFGMKLLDNGAFYYCVHSLDEVKAIQAIIV